MNNGTAVSIYLKEDQSLLLWNEVMVYAPDADSLEETIYNRLISEGLPVKNLHITCTGFLHLNINFDNDKWKDNEVRAEIKPPVLTGVPVLTKEEKLAKALYEVSEDRRKLYVTMTDTLFNKALVLSAQGKHDEALLLQEEGLALRTQIQLQHPYPEGVVSND